MERITGINKDGEIYKTSCEISDADAWKKLAEYEEMEEKGMLVKIPCKVGSIVYDTCLGIKEKCEVVSFEIKKNEIFAELKSSLTHGSVNISEFGETVFKNNKDAEKKIKGE